MECILQAAPGSGKTAFCLQAAADCGFPALFVTAEMPPLALFRRLIARATGTYLGRLQSGELAPEVVEALARQAARKLPQVVILDATRAFAPAAAIQTSAGLLRERFGARNVLLVLDSLQVWAHGACKDATLYEQVSAAVDSARELALALGAPLLAVNQRNRQGQKEGGMHAGKGSGDLEYTAESVLELTRQGPADARGVTAVVLAVHKNRHGEAGVEIPLAFEGRVQSFREA